MPAKMFRLLITATLAVTLGGCSKDDESEDPAKKWGPEIQALRKNIGRNGTLVRGLTSYLFAIGAYPTTEQGLKALMRRPKGLADPKGWSGPYCQEDDMIDMWGNEFKYVFPGKTHENKYDLWSIGPDKEDGTEDDILSWNVQ